MVHRQGEPLRLSVLDTGSIRSGQSAADALAAALGLAQVAEAHGYLRYWFAEHHNTAAVIGQDSLTLAAIVGARTTSIRVGGYVLTPHRSPLWVAEQASLVEAAYPGRVDIAVNGAPGTDPETAQLLRGAGPPMDHMAWVLKEARLLSPGVLSRRRVIPSAATIPSMTLVGGSREEAQVAGQLGLGFHYPFHVIGESDGAEVVATYFGAFVPREGREHPEASASAIVIAAPSSEEAERWVRGHEYVLAAFRSGRLTSAQPTLEELDTLTVPSEFERMIAMFRRTWIVGTPGVVAEKLSALATALGVPEIAIVPMPAEDPASPPDASPHREWTVREVARAVQARVGA